MDFVRSLSLFPVPYVLDPRRESSVHYPGLSVAINIVPSPFIHLPYVVMPTLLHSHTLASVPGAGVFLAFKKRSLKGNFMPKGSFLPLKKDYVERPNL